MSRFAGKRVLLLDQGMLKDRHGKPIHGIELFRVRLIRQLLELGVDVTVGLESSWRAVMEREFPEDGARPECVYGPGWLKGTPLNGLWAAWAAKRRAKKRWGGSSRYDAVVFGNVRRGLLPAMKTALRGGLAERALVFAHRPPTERVGRAVARMGAPVLAVSEHVAGPYREAGVERVGVYYGLANVGEFFPASDDDRAANDDGVTRFCLVAKLPHVIKGEDRAVAAFEKLPESVRSKAELHLASWISEAPYTQRGVVCHPWMTTAEVAALLRRMDVMLCLSSTETFSQAIVQGMLTELPVVATPLPVYTEKLDPAEGGAGGVICETDEEIAEAMLRLAEDGELRRRMGRAGRAVAMEKYVWDSERFLGEYVFGEETERRRDGETA